MFENTKRLDGNLRATPPLPHADIQIYVGNPIVPFHKFRFKVTGVWCGDNQLRSPDYLMREARPPRPSQLEAGLISATLRNPSDERQHVLEAPCSLSLPFRF